MSVQKLLEQAEDPNTPQPSSERVFLEFRYIEMRDLLKHFLTLISGSLVFSVAFSSNIIDYNSASSLPRFFAASSWFALVVALGSCGIGLFALYIGAERAMRNAVFGEKHDYRYIVWIAYIFQDLAGALYGLGLVCLVLGAYVGNTPSAPNNDPPTKQVAGPGVAPDRPGL